MTESTGAPDAKVTFMVMYGPPRTRRGRFLNRLRRLFGREEQFEVLWAGAPAEEGLTVHWDASGRFRL